MLIGGGIGFIVGLAFTLALLLIGKPLHGDEFARVITSPIEFAGFGAGLGGFTALLTVREATTATLGADLLARRQIVRAVLRGRRVQLSPADGTRAARYAVVLQLTQPYRLAASGGVFVGAVANFVPILFETDDGVSRTTGLVGGILLLLALLIAIPAAIRQSRNVARYARDRPLQADLALRSD